jgi:DNA-binding MarR family transcriptional regulator
VADEPETTEDPTESLHASIRRLAQLFASRKVTANLAQVAGTELSQQAIAMLRVLNREGELPIAELAQEARMDLGAVSRQLRVMESSSLVQRKEDPSDRRVALVRLTRSGTALAQRIRRIELDQLNRVFRGWDATDLDQLASLLARMVDDLAGTEFRRA